MGNLFERGGLQQDTGLLRNRWGQQGSTVVNISDAPTGSEVTMHTVTAGKILYITAMTFSTLGGSSGTFAIKDGGTGGTIKVNASKTANIGESQSITFDTPLTFETDLFYHALTGSNTLGGIVFTGWEEQPS